MSEVVILSSVALGLNSFLLALGGWAMQALHTRLAKRVDDLGAKADQLQEKYNDLDKKAMARKSHENDLRTLDERLDRLGSQCSMIEVKCQGRASACERKFDEGSGMFSSLTEIMKRVEDQIKKSTARDRIMLAAMENLCRAVDKGGEYGLCGQIEELAKQLNWEDLK